jgi:aryl-alcohol dehydrogenase-like predicted oxidoreductase
MQYTNLGRTGARVSRLCLGTMNFGPETSEADSHAIMSKALDLGINFWDTADVYGWKKGESWTESIIGRWFKANPSKRDQVVLATKFYNAMGDGPNDRGNSAFHMRQAIEKSLKALQTDHIDLYQMHHIDRSSSWDEIWQGYDVLIRQGKVVYAGSSNFAGWHIAKANESAKRHLQLGLVAEQCKFSLYARHAELEILPAAKDYGMGVIPWSPVAGGMLAGTSEPGKRRQGDWVKAILANNKPRLDKYEAFCKELGEKCADVALAWTLHHPAVTAPIIGPRTMDQLTGSLRAIEIKLSPEHLKQLDAIWPPAGNPDVQKLENPNPLKYESPEAFAW